MSEADPFEDFIGEEVVDAQGNPIGTLECYWEHEAGKPVLLGIDVGELAHKTHLLPAKGARPNERQSYVVVKYNRTARSIPAIINPSESVIRP